MFTITVIISDDGENTNVAGTITEGPLPSTPNEDHVMKRLSTALKAELKALGPFRVSEVDYDN